MKIKILFSAFFVFSKLLGVAQNHIDFENTSTFDNFTIDTTNHNNIWQIGNPEKVLFDNAFSIPNAIITDTVFNYPINNNSEFVLRATNLSSYNLFLQFKYKINTDSLFDYGKIYASSNLGLTWVDISNNTLPANLHWSIASGSDYCPGTLALPLTGTSTGWNEFNFWSTGANVLTTDYYIDTILLKFTFHSDSIQTNKEGWMIDNIEFGNYEGVQEFNSVRSNLVVYPNPAEKKIRIANNDWEGDVLISVFNIQGQLLFTYLTRQPDNEVDISGLANGIYTIQAVSNNRIKNGKFIKE